MLWPKQMKALKTWCAQILGLRRSTTWRSIYSNPFDNLALQLALTGAWGDYDMDAHVSANSR